MEKVLASFENQSICFHFHNYFPFQTLLTLYSCFLSVCSREGLAYSDPGGIMGVASFRWARGGFTHAGAISEPGTGLENASQRILERKETRLRTINLQLATTLYTS